MKPGPSRLATLAMGGGAVDREGRVLVAATSKDSWFWRAAVLGPGGELQPIPAAFEGDMTGQLMFMQSSGGLTGAGRFQGKDAILSGPAGGAVAGWCGSTLRCCG